MTRSAEMRGGSFERLLGGWVQAKGWWLCHAAGVECRAPESHLVVALDASEVARGLPIALQSNDAQLPLDLVAAKVEELDGGARLDVAYPFRVALHEGRVRLTFGEGTSDAVKTEIGVAFADRFRPVRA